jgi:hypothetical protein
VNPEQHNSAQAREDQYQEVSLRAVELLANAQRAADEAVAEAQAYARDLEQSAREQYRQILQRANDAAREVTGGEGAARPAGQAGQAGQTGQTGPTGAGPQAAAHQSTLEAQQLVYVRTYARVAHEQLKSVLSALTHELDQLAAMAEGRFDQQGGGAPTGNPASSSSATGLSLGAGVVGGAGQAATTEPAAPVEQLPNGLPRSYAVAPRREKDAWGLVHDPGSDGAASDGPGANRAGSERPGAAGEASWPPIFAATNAISYVFRGSSDDQG